MANVECTESLSSRIQSLEGKLKGVQQLADWRLEQLKLMDVGKRAAEKSLEEERRLFADLSAEHVRQNTAQMQALQENWYSLMSKNEEAGEGNVVGVQRPPIVPVSHAMAALHTMPKASLKKLERSLDGMREQLKLRSDERDKLKANCRKLEEEARDQSRKLSQSIMESQRWKAEAAKSTAAASEGKNQEEVCRDLLEQLEQRRLELRRCEEGRRMAAKGLAESKRKLDQRDDEIQKLERILDDQKRNKVDANAYVTECIICMDRFGEEPDRQRAHWKDCNHANVCYKCTNTLWSSNKRKCPSCNTPASDMPGRLSPNIYL